MTPGTHLQRCTVIGDEPFHTRVWDSLCRNMPKLSTGHEDRLLPGSWTTEPPLPPAVVARGLPVPVVPIPDTTSVHVPGLGITTAQGVTPAAHYHLIAHIDTTLDHWFGVGFDPAGDFLAFNGTATPVVAQSPDDRAVRVSLCASVRKDDETVHFTAFGSVVGGHVQDIYGTTPAPWRGHRVLGAGALLRPEPHPAQPAGDELQQSSRP